MDEWILHFDGLTEPINPGGWMCWGWTLDRAGMPTLFDSGAVAPAKQNTNNIGEYLACGWGIRKAAELAAGSTDGFPGLKILGDSQIVIFQLSGKYKCHKEHLARLRDRCLALLNELPQKKWSVEWVSRDLNGDADELSRQAYIKATGKYPPDRSKKVFGRSGASNA